MSHVLFKVLTNKGSILWKALAYSIIGKISEIKVHFLIKDCIECHKYKGFCRNNCIFAALIFKA
tara:strand:- start:18513 stop:18704 length:192 start_codon:yes stop_codon:yes gene_type:complete